MTTTITTRPFVIETRGESFYCDTFFGPNDDYAAFSVEPNGTGAWRVVDHSGLRGVIVLNDVELPDAMKFAADHLCHYHHCEDGIGCTLVPTDCCSEPRWQCETVMSRDGEYENGLRLCKEDMGCGTTKCYCVCGHQSQQAHADAIVRMLENDDDKPEDY